MRRADRLFRIIQILRQRKVVTAAYLAEQLEVSERTVYRDVRDLVTSGTPIEGEAGVGYSLRSGYDLPPLMFTEEEIEALVLGARIVRSVADTDLAKASESAIGKIESVLPKHLKPRLSDSSLFAPDPSVSVQVSRKLAPVRRAIAEGRKLHIAYATESGERTERVVRPLGAFYWGRVWTLGAWCELRADFRNFRVDRIEQATVLDELAGDEPGRTLNDFLRAMAERDEARELGRVEGEAPRRAAASGIQPVAAAIEARKLASGLD